MKKWTLFLTFVALPFGAQAAETMYVQSIKANIQSSPAFNSKVLGRALKGDALEVIEKNYSWYKVKYREETGWVSRFLVSARPPLDRVSVLAGDTPSIEKESRRRASVATTTAAVRGLAAEDRQRAHAQGAMNYTDLEKMDAFKVDEQEALAFLEKGMK